MLFFGRRRSRARGYLRFGFAWATRRRRPAADACADGFRLPSGQDSTMGAAAILASGRGWGLGRYFSSATLLSLLSSQAEIQQCVERGRTERIGSPPRISISTSGSPLAGQSLPTDWMPRPSEGPISRPPSRFRQRPFEWGRARRGPFADPKPRWRRPKSTTLPLLKSGRAPLALPRGTTIRSGPGPDRSADVILPNSIRITHRHFKSKCLRNTYQSKVRGSKA